LPLTKAVVVGEEMHNVFPGNTFIEEPELPFSKEIMNEVAEEHPKVQAQKFLRNTFRARIVPFNRSKEALKLVEQDISTFKEEERSQLKQALEEFEQSLAQIKAKL
jgi:predicted flavoprotein YhiN